MTGERSSYFQVSCLVRIESMNLYGNDVKICHVESTLSTLFQKLAQIHLRSENLQTVIYEHVEKKSIWNFTHPLLKKLDYVLKHCDTINKQLCNLQVQQNANIQGLYILGKTTQDIELVKTKFISLYLFANPKKYPYASQRLISFILDALKVIGNNVQTFTKANRSVLKCYMPMPTTRNKWLHMARELRKQNRIRLAKRFAIQVKKKQRRRKFFVLRRFQILVCQVILVRKSIDSWTRYTRRKIQQKTQLKRGVHEVAQMGRIHAYAKELIRRGTLKKRVKHLWRKAYGAIRMLKFIHLYWKQEKYPDVLRRKVDRLVALRRKRLKYKLLWDKVRRSLRVRRQNRAAELALHLNMVNTKEVIIAALRQSILGHICCIKDFFVVSGLKTKAVLFLARVLEEYIHILNYYRVPTEIVQFKYINMRKFFKSRKVSMKKMDIRQYTIRFFTFSLHVLRYSRLDQWLFHEVKTETQKWVSMMFMNIWTSMLLYLQHMSTYITSMFEIVNLDLRNHAFFENHFVQRDNVRHVDYKKENVDNYKRISHVNMDLNFEEIESGHDSIHYQHCYCPRNINDLEYYINSIVSNIFVQLTKFKVKNAPTMLSAISDVFSESYNTVERNVLVSREFDLELCKRIRFTASVSQVEIRAFNETVFEMFCKERNDDEKKTQTRKRKKPSKRKKRKRRRGGRQ